jgi:hypothetical protein
MICLGFVRWRDDQAIDSQSQCNSEISLLSSQGVHKTAMVKECIFGRIVGFHTRFGAAQGYRSPWLQGPTSKNKGKIEYTPDLNQDRAPFLTLRNRTNPPPSFQTGGTPPSPVQIHQTVRSPIPIDDRSDLPGWSRDYSRVLTVTEVSPTLPWSVVIPQQNRHASTQTAIHPREYRPAPSTDASLGPILVFRESRITWSNHQANPCKPTRGLPPNPPRPHRIKGRRD